MRLATAVLACSLGVGLAAVPALRAERAVDVIAPLAGAGAVAVVLVLTIGVRLLPLPLLLLAAELELHHVLEPFPAAALAAYAGGLLLLGELLAWSLSLRGLERVDRAAVVTQSVFLCAIAAGAAALGAAVLGASALRLTGGLGDAAIGITAAVLLFASISKLARGSSHALAGE